MPWNSHKQKEPYNDGRHRHLPSITRKGSTMPMPWNFHNQKEAYNDGRHRHLTRKRNTMTVPHTLTSHYQKEEYNDGATELLPLPERGVQ